MEREGRRGRKGMEEKTHKKDMMGRGRGKGGRERKWRRGGTCIMSSIPGMSPFLADMTESSECEEREEILRFWGREEEGGREGRS